jgi:hypothetical protein
MVLTLKQLKELQDEFLQTDVMDYANGVGIGAGDSTNPHGFTVMFESKEKLEAWPCKENSYKGVPINRKVVGVIRAL